MYLPAITCRFEAGLDKTSRKSRENSLFHPVFISSSNPSLCCVSDYSVLAFCAFPFVSSLFPCPFLIDELHKPMHIHRWRTLQDTDSELYARIRRLHDLQHQLLKKSDQVESQDAVLAQKEKVYVRLRQTVQKQEGTGVTAQKQIKQYMELLQQKKEKLKVSDD